MKSLSYLCRHVCLFKSQVVCGGRSSTLEYEGRRMLSSCRASCTTRPPFIPPSPPFFLCFEISHLLALIPSVTPSLCPSLRAPHLFLSPSFHLPLLLSTFPLTSLPFSLSFPPFLSLPPFASPPSFHKCGWWLAGSCWLASGGGYSFIIPPRLPARLATMSQELNICHYYLLVLFDFEAAQ